MQRSSRSAALVVLVYVSVGRDAAMVARLSSAAGPSCIHVFRDLAYNRTGFILAARGGGGEAVAGALRVSQLALRALDLRHHSASHPRLGVVDHIAVHAIGDWPTEDGGGAGVALRAARLLGVELAATPPGGLPVFLYGLDRPLDALRRSLGYFARAADAQAGATAGGAPAPSPPAPDLGPLSGAPGLGVACIGAPGGWVTNYNLALTLAGGERGSEEVLLARCRSAAAVVSARRGGPPGCQALALPHGPGTCEVACNLLAPLAPPPEEVKRLVQHAAERLGLQLVGDYFTGLTPEELMERAV